MTRTRASSCRQSCIGTLLAFAISSLPAVSHADASTEVLRGVVVEDAWTLPAEPGAKLRLRFRIENTSGRTVVLEGIRSTLAMSGFLLMEEGFYERPAEQLFVADQEVLELDTSHFSAVLTELERRVEAGDVVHFELVFRSGTVPARAHVHEEQ